MSIDKPFLGAAAMALKATPLVEVIAELRWPSQLMPQPGAHNQMIVNHQQFMMQDTSAAENFFMAFGGRAHLLGFSKTERLLPMGFPIVPNQAVYRFRQDNGASKVYQVGAGVFTSNAMPPYKSWKEYSPDVAKGVEALISSRGDSEKDQPFSSVSLRYVDAFHENLTGGRDIAKFLEEVFKLKLSLPDAILKNLAEGQEVIPVFQLQVPLANNFMMHLAIGNGISNGAPGIVMDTTVITTTPTAANVDAVMANLFSAHEIIHQMFFELVHPIHDLFTPEGVE